MVGLKSAAKSLLLGVLRGSGAFNAACFALRHRVLILTVHGVDDGSESQQGLSREQLDPERLGAFVELLLQRGFRFHTLADAAAMIDGRTALQAHSAVITFDDGYVSQLTHGVATLRRYGVPSTIFVCSRHASTGEPFWWDRLDYVLRNLRGQSVSATLQDQTLTIAIPVDGALTGVFRRICWECKRAGLPSTERFIAEMEDRFRVALTRETAATDGRLNVATWDQIRSHAGTDLEIGSHCDSHVLLDQLATGEVREQLARSKEAIEREVGAVCTSLCYPNGNTLDETVRIAAAVGYDAAVTLERGLNRCGADTLRLRRLSVPRSATQAEFLALVTRLQRLWNPVG